MLCKYIGLLMSELFERPSVNCSLLTISHICVEMLLVREQLTSQSGDVSLLAVQAENPVWELYVVTSNFEEQEGQKEK